MSIRIAGQVIASAGSLTAHNHDAEAHPDIRALIQGGGSGSVEQATEERAGIVALASQEEALEAFDDSKAMTPLKTAQKVYESVGRVIQLGFDGTLSGNILTFEPDTDVPYEIKNGYSYEIDLLFPAVVADGKLDDDIEIVINNNGESIKIVNALNDDPSTNITVKDMRQLMKYSTDIGFRWIFNARFATTQDSVKVFVIPSTVINDQGLYTKDNLVGGTDIEFVKEVVGGGQIDNDTILMLNLDGNAEDSSFYKGELSFGDASGWTYGEGKFGQMALSGDAISITDDNNTLFNAVDKVTVDYTTFFSANASDTAMVRVVTQGGADVYTYAYYYRGKILEAYINGSTTSIDTTNIDLEQYLQISYEISEGKVVVFINGNPVLTKEDSNIKMGTGLSSLQVKPPTSGNAGLDEVRVSKCLRYNGQPFEIPTQPYGPATETGRTLVKYVGDKPKGVYTEENLIGGKGVEIVKETASEGIDENTLACWHFDTDNKDVVNNLNYGSGQQHNTQYKKFGEASIRTTYAFENGLLSDTSSDWTIEGFFHRTSAGATAWVILGKGTYFTGSDVDGACFMLKTSGNVATLKNAKDDAVISTSIDTNSFEEWEHVAFQRKGGLLQGFHKGKKILEKAVSADGTPGTFRTGGHSGYSVLLDEARISKVARYDGDFEPPTKPFSDATYETGRRTIKAEGKADTDLGNIPTNYDYVVESKYPTEEDSSWYRVYKSGWVEQGARVSSTTENTALTVTLLKPMINNRYCVQRTSASTSSTAATFRSFGITGITTTTFNMYITDTLSPTYWYVCGQGA